MRKLVRRVVGSVWGRTGLLLGKIPGTSWVSSWWGRAGRHLDLISNIIIAIIVTGLMLLMLHSATGCASTGGGWLGFGGGGTPSPKGGGPTLDQSLNRLIVVSVFAIAASVVLFFCVPAAYRISTGLGLGAASLLVVSYVVKLTLPLIPWVIAGIAILGLGVLVYEIWHKKKFGVFDRNPLDGPNASTGTSNS